MKNSEELIEFWENFRAFQEGLTVEDIEQAMQMINATNFFPQVLMLHPSQIELIQEDAKFVWNTGRMQGKTEVRNKHEEFRKVTRILDT